MSHWNLQVTVGNIDKEIMRRVAGPVAKWRRFANCRAVGGRNCSSAQERGGNYGRRQQIMAFTQGLWGLSWVFSNYVKWEHRFFFPLNMVNQKERDKKERPRGCVSRR